MAFLPFFERTSAVRMRPVSGAEQALQLALSRTITATLAWVMPSSGKAAKTRSSTPFWASGSSDWHRKGRSEVAISFPQRCLCPEWIAPLRSQ
jgi:hypothetical protein